MRLRDFFHLLRYLLSSSGGVQRPRLLVVCIAASGILAGVASTGLLAVINVLLNDDAAHRYLAGWIFLGLCLLLPLTRFTSNYLLVRLSQGVNFDLRVRLSRRILAAPLRRLEELGAGRLLATLTDDIQVITAALTQVPTFFLQFTVVVGCLVYMGWLSPELLMVVLAGVVFGVLSYELPAADAQQYYHRARERWDDVVHSFRGLTEGTKELKMHAARRGEFVDHRLAPAASELRDHVVAGGTLYAAANSWGQTLFFVLIGFLLFFGLGWVEASRQIAIGYTMAILYMLTPLDVLLNFVPAFGRAVVAASKVETLGLSLEAAGDDIGSSPLAAEATSGWRRLVLDGVTHTYHREDVDDSFSLGPVDLEIHRGELLFLTGGNGSGKTSLAKVLIGLYRPESGRVCLDDEAVTEENRDSFRQLFSVVFSDFFLFESLLGLAGRDLEAEDYLRQLHLHHKVRVTDGELSTLDLSQGQRKRLALLTAYLEDRPIYLFDEWAADQDPYFKEIFYRQILPGLQQRGKTVVVISHDDRYYPLADRLVKLDYGQVVFDGPPAELEAQVMAGEPSTPER